MFLRNDVTVHLAGTRRGTPTFPLSFPHASVSRKVTMSSLASAGNTYVISELGRSPLMAILLGLFELY